MKTINNNTKLAQRFINAYNSSRIFDVYRAYGKPSTAKVRAENNCLLKMLQESGHDYKIIGYNSFQFSVAWIAGNSLRIETACNSFVIPQAL